MTEPDQGILPLAERLGELADRAEELAQIDPPPSAEALERIATLEEELRQALDSILGARKGRPRSTGQGVKPKRR